MNRVGKGGEDEIRVRHWQELPLGLAAMGIPLPKMPPRSHRYQRLDDLISVALWVGLRLHVRP